MRAAHLVIIALLSVSLASCHGEAPEAKAAREPLKLPAARAQAQAATGANPGEAAPQAELTVTGTAGAQRTSPVSTRVGGILHALKAREGARVVAGDVLAELDSTDTQLRAEAAAVAVQQAEEGIRNAESDLKRAEEMSRGGAMTDQGLEKARLAVRMARLQAEGARVALRMSRQAVTDATLKAPFDGTVTRVLVEEGQSIVTMPPTPLLVLADTDALEVRVAIPERNVAQVRPGMQAVVTFPALGLERKAEVDRMPDVLDPATRSVPAIIRLDNRDHAVPAGSFATVRFPGVPAAAQARTAPAVAPSALQTGGSRVEE
jgi:RND family efflux transporter MFP subunit